MSTSTCLLALAGEVWAPLSVSATAPVYMLPTRPSGSFQGDQPHKASLPLSEGERCNLGHGRSIHSAPSLHYVQQSNTSAQAVSGQHPTNDKGNRDD